MAAAQTITIVEPNFTQPTYYCKVYTRSVWDDPWVHQPLLHCENFTEEMNPGIGKAVVTARSGNLFDAASGNYITYAALNLNGVYIKVEVLHVVTDDIVREWYGVAPSQAVEVESAAGRYRWQCYDMRYFLSRYRIINADHMTDDEFVEGKQAINFGKMAHTFNDKGKPNRSLSKVDLAGEPATYIFAREEDDPKPWSTRNIVEYLIKRVAESEGISLWAIKDEELNKLPNWDNPVVTQDGRTIKEVLDQLITRFRLYGWDAVYNDTTNKFDINILTYTNANFNLPNVSFDIPANTGTVSIISFQSSAIKYDLTEDRLHEVDQFVVEGDKLVFVLSASDANNRLIPKWTKEIQDAYEEGGQSQPNYPPSDLTAKRKFTENFRSRDEYFNVFRTFQLPKEFDAGDGYNSMTKNVLPSTQMIVGVDYTTTSPIVDPGKTDERPIFGIIKVPDGSGKYVHIDEVRQLGYYEDENINAPNKWSATLRNKKASGTFEIHVTGLRKHLLGAYDADPAVDGFKFDPIDEVDDDQNLGKWSWKDIIVTLAYEDDRSLRAVFPTTIPPEVEQIRRMVVSVEGYKKIAMLSETVVDIDKNTGLPVKSPSELIYLRNDEDKIKDLAKLGWEYYGKERRTIDIAFPLTEETKKFKVGQYIENVDLTTIGTVVTKLEFSLPFAESSEPQPGLDISRLKLTTGFADLDILKL